MFVVVNNHKMRFLTNVSDSDREPNDIPNLKAGAIVFDASGCILLVRQSNGNISLPKGSVKWHERMYEAALREVKEESGLDLSTFHSEKYETAFYKTSFYMFFVHELQVRKEDLYYNPVTDSLEVIWKPILEISTEWLTSEKMNKLTFKYLSQFVPKNKRD